MPVFPPVRAKGQKPLFGTVEIDWAHPLSRGLVIAHLFNERGQPINLVKNTLATATGTWDSNPDGIVMTLNGSQDITLPHVYDGNTDVTVVARGVLTSTASYPMIWSPLNGSGGNELRFNASTQLLEFVNYGDSATTQDPDNTPLNTPSQFAGSQIGGTINVYRDGKLRNSASPGGSVGAYSGSNYIGSRGGSFPWIGQISSLLFFARGLDDSEIAQLYAEPYAFLRPKVARTYSITKAVAPPPSGGGGMAYPYFLRRPKNQKPLFGTVEVDWGHPLSRGLVACWLFNEGGGSSLTNLVKPDATAIADTTNVIWTGGPRGMGLQATANAGTTAGITVSPAITVSGAWSWDTIIAPTASIDSFACLITQSNAFGIFYNNLKLYVYLGVPVFNNSTAITAGTTHHYVLSIDASLNSAAYLDGLPDGTGTVGSSSANLDRCFNDPSSETFDGMCYFHRIWNRDLTSGEAAWLSAEPYAFLRPKVARMYSWPVRVAAAATGKPWIYYANQMRA